VPDRVRAIFSAVRQARLINSPNPLPDMEIALAEETLAAAVARSDQIVELAPEGVDETFVRRIHSGAHIEQVKHICQAGGGVLDQGDTPVCSKSYEIALLALGAMRVCCDAVLCGQAKRAFAAVRPPGHHAERDRAMGFCLFNNIAFAARYAQQTHGVQRIAIVDFDVHHGNGTQAIFEADADVLFVSLHQDPRTCYPGSGYDWEIGVGQGRGATINLPLDPGSGDDEYLKVLDEKVLTAIDSFHPGLLLLSAGFDAHRDDPLAHMRLSDDGFEQITRRLAASADRCCAGRMVSVLEGGYNLRALGRCVVRHLLGMCDQP